MNDEDFKRMVIDYFDLETRRNLRLMATMEEFNAKADEIIKNLDLLVKAMMAAGGEEKLDEVMKMWNELNDRIKAMHAKQDHSEIVQVDTSHEG